MRRPALRRACASIPNRRRASSLVGLIGAGSVAFGMTVNRLASMPQRIQRISHIATWHNHSFGALRDPFLHRSNGLEKQTMSFFLKHFEGVAMPVSTSSRETRVSRNGWSPSWEVGRSL